MVLGEQVGGRDKSLTATIVSVATEVLKGHITDANLSWLIKRLAALGIDVVKGVILPDDKSLLVKEIRSGLEDSDLLFICGGLGPTKDDITREALAEALNRKLVLSEKALNLLNKYYSSRGMEVDDYRLKMAYIVEGAEIIPNPLGAAPGMTLKHGDKWIFVFPGVPRELRSMFSTVEPRLKAITPVKYVVRRILVDGWREADLYRFLERWFEGYDDVYFKVLLNDEMTVVLEYPPNQSIESLIDELIRRIGGKELK